MLFAPHIDFRYALCVPSCSLQSAFWPQQNSDRWPTGATTERAGKMTHVAATVSVGGASVRTVAFPAAMVTGPNAA